MPAKSQHGKGKHTTRSKRKVVRAAVDTRGQPQAVSPVAAETRSEMVAAPAGASRRAVVPTVDYPYLAGDLKRTGFLAGIILVLLLVLYFVLS